MIEDIKNEDMKRFEKHKQNIKNFRQNFKGKEKLKSNKKSQVDDANKGLFEEEEVDGDQFMFKKDSKNANISNFGSVFTNKNKNILSKLKNNIKKTVLKKPKLMESFGLRSRVLNMFHNEIYK